MKAGVLSYLQRRASRILPPYYAARALVLLLILVTPGLQHPADAHWDDALPALKPGPIVTHLLLIHNLFGHWGVTIDPPMWSVGVEWQIYFLFPFLLLPLWRRGGDIAFLAVALLISAVITKTHIEWLAQSQLVFLFPFAAGMLGALISFSTRQHYRSLYLRVPWGGIALLVFGVMSVAALKKPGILMHNTLYSLPLVGLATMALMIYLTRSMGKTDPKARPLPLRLLESKPMTQLGKFSYSLYLIHFPILALVHIPLRAMHLGPTTRYGILLLVAAPLSIGLAYLSHLAFERPFLPGTRPAPVAADVVLAQA